MSSADRDRSRARHFGAIVPCRNEVAVLERKLSNLVRLDWPSGPQHRVVVVDDGSTDGTRESAERAARVLSNSAVKIEVLSNRGPAGKASAVNTALEHLGDEVDLILLTDADVVLRESSPRAFVRAFEGDDRVGMATAAQEFVVDLAEDGSCQAPDGADLVFLPDRYDRWTAAVRRFESGQGRVFSVHGQALCWRQTLDLQPSRGFVADDIDLMLQTRAAGARVVLAEGASFLECKIPAGDARTSQVRRRAAGYFHLVRRTQHPLRGGLFDRVQWACYRFLPGAVPLLVPATLLGLPVALGATLGWIPGGAAALGCLAACCSPIGRDVARLLSVIRRGSRQERAGGVSDSWEMARTP